MEKDPKKGLVVFSFALRSEEEEPNPCNILLAREAERIILMERITNKREVVVVAQWEVARQLEKDHYQVDHIVRPIEGRYLDSDQVWKEAKEIFGVQGITEVIPIANPWWRLQTTKVSGLIKRDGYQVVKRHIGRIGFDRSRKNTQWYTRGGFRLLLYAVMQQFTGFRGTAQQNSRP